MLYITIYTIVEYDRCPFIIRKRRKLNIYVYYFNRFKSFYFIREIYRINFGKTSIKNQTCKYFGRKKKTRMTTSISSEAFEKKTER